MSEERKELAGKVVLVTGGTRGIGKAIALRAARLGAKVALTYRDPAKQARAQRVVRELEGQAGSESEILLLQADVTLEADRAAMYRAVRERFGRIDGLVLNAAGGLEADKGPDYARVINHDAQLALVEEGLKAGLLGAGSWAIYMTSLWAHRWGQMEALPGYAPVAQTKHAAEQSLRKLQPALEEQGVKLAVVVGHLITETGAFALFRRKDKARIEQLAQEVEGERLPTPADVAEATLAVLTEDGLESGYTVFVGRPKEEAVG